ncbi:hypothetical protein M758_3G107000 [Ceratodon purpureus]|uniref:Uncharacterized protein n=1 Tax=Ceratodon purpureus TaxID=3225 RepID=A0A8T0IJD4_CERPU|nr:hypothetical protein KC19_3G105000 [Ceratodon purpureus]KAG0622560.1 hypothetical protein M758_3G107000 [Ceratodon purpureus]
MTQFSELTTESMALASWVTSPIKTNCNEMGASHLAQAALWQICGFGGGDAFCCNYRNYKGCQNYYLCGSGALKWSDTCMGRLRENWGLTSLAIRHWQLTAANS